MPENPAPAPLDNSTPQWNEARPAIIPEPTLWPSALALGATFMLWGLASSLIISGVGVVLFALALTGWISNIRHERRQS
jgi:hypothetical protein